MFETLSHFSLQQYWWIIISVLAALLVFLMFVQGGQTMIYRLGRNETERTMIVNALGRKWEFTFTTLVTFGGAFFASFPLFYSTSFGGAYWVWLLILFAFVIQAISYEFRRKPNNFLGQKTYETFLFINGALGTILIGTAVATFFTGSEFSMEKINLTNLTGERMPIISSWETPYHGLEAALNFHNISLGLAVFFLARTLAALYFIRNIDNENIIARTKKCLLINGIAFTAFFLTFFIWLLFIDGVAYNPETLKFFKAENKYWQNLLEMPLNTVIFLLGVVSVLWGIIGTLLKPNYDKGIWFAGAGTVMTVFSLFILAGFNNTAFYPSSFDISHSLTIRNSSSSHYTLTAMSYVSLLVPFVIAYIVWTWRLINKKKITAEEFSGDEHAY